MLKVFNPLLQLVTTQMYGYEILCSNGAWRGREIIINPAVGCFLLFPWNNCDKGYCHGCFTAVVTVVSLLWNKCDNSVGTTVSNGYSVFYRKLQSDNDCLGCVIIYKKWSFLLDI